MAKSNNSVEDTLSQYVGAIEDPRNNSVEIKANKMPGVDNLNFDSIRSQEDISDKDKTQKKNALEELNEAKAEKMEEIKEYQKKHSLGYLEIPIQDLPTKGMFYPEGTKIRVRAVTGAEIRSWSTVDEQSLDEIDDALNRILERCMIFTLPESQTGSWKDLKDIDRLYVILAIRDFTFTSGNNELKIKINETRDEVVNKDNIDFVNFPEKLISHYSQDKRCFVFDIPQTGRSLNIYLPCVGVSSWLKEYVQKKSRRQEGFDREFITMAPMLIKDYRNLNDKTYEQFILNCSDFGVYEYSLIAKIKAMFNEILDPKFKYLDEDGAEQTAPLNFRGGIKGFFLLDVDDLI